MRLYDAITIVLSFVVLGLMVWLSVLLFMEIARNVSIACRTKRTEVVESQFKVISKHHSPGRLQHFGNNLIPMPSSYNVKIETIVDGGRWRFTIDNYNLYRKVELGDRLNYRIKKCFDDSNRLIDVRLV